MASVSFYPRTKKGSSKIQVRIVLGRAKRFLISTQISVENVETDWDFKKKMPREPRRKRILEMMRTKFLNHITDVELDLSLGNPIDHITTDDFRKIVYDIHRTPERLRTYKKTESESFNGYTQTFIARCKEKGYRTKSNKLKQYTIGTLRKYKQMIDTVALFEGEEKSKMYLNSFDSKMVDRFESFLTEHYAISTAGRKLKALKTILTDAYNHNKDVNPHFKLIKGYSYETTVVPLSEMEQEIIFATPMPTKELEVARDWLLVLCGTGQRFVDVNTLAGENVKNHIKDGVISIKQRKTGNVAEIPIFDRVQRIIDKYDGFPPTFTDNESSQNAKLNELIKEVCKECGLKEELDEIKNGKRGLYKKHELITTKTGRKSLATYLYKELRWDAQSCMAITGHKQLDNFFLYVGGKNSAITEANKKRVAEINKDTIEKRGKKIKAV
jgi:integrase